MTTATAVEVDRRKGGRPRNPRTIAGDLGRRLGAAADASGAFAQEHRWPSTRYQADPVAFFREVLGVEPWSRQIEVIEAVRDHKRVAVRSGHKVSKSHTAGGIAEWFFHSFEDARVVMTSTTSRQVDQILWRELKMMHARSGRCVDCKALDRQRAERREPLGPRPCPHSLLLDGDPPILARTGLRSPDFREIVGFTAREAEAVAGVSGKNLLYIVDEASGVSDEIFEAIEGNRAGGARIVMFSNPTRTEGEHYAAFDSKASLYRTITISSEESPNVVEGREVIPGLATREWVEEKRIEWGEDSPLYKIRVKGEHVLSEDGKILSVHAITQAEIAWPDAVAEGRLYLGLDPAGPGAAGDETGFAPRRGAKVLELFAQSGLSEDAIVVHARAFVGKHRKPYETQVPAIVVDREGPIGSALYYKLRDIAEKNPIEFAVFGVKSSDKATRKPHLYERTRDELHAATAEWIRQGGAIPPDAKLAKELHAPEWTSTIGGKLKATPKDEIKKAIGRSPDRADALQLAVWEPVDHLEQLNEARQSAREPAEESRIPAMDPYAALTAWGRR